VCQIGQVFSGYLADYFQKESIHVRNQYSELLRLALEEDQFAITKPATYGPLIHLPAMRPERVKSAAGLVQTVANKVFLNRIFSATTDTVGRMESIGRDDKKLTVRLKDLFVLQMTFLSDALFVPWSKACVQIMLKLIATKGGSTTSTAPPVEVLAVLSALTYGVSRIKTHFDEVFYRPISAVPNILAVSKESRLKAFKELDLLARQLFNAWTQCTVANIEKTLTSLQSKYDYAPRFETLDAARIGGGGAVKLVPTVACDAACRALQTAISYMRSYESKLLNVDLTKLFWRPLGQQMVGLIISHVRRLKVSPDGNKFLSRDLREYAKVMYGSYFVCDIVCILYIRSLFFCAFYFLLFMFVNYCIDVPVFCVIYFFPSF
jgi:hypothetical protein